MKRYVRVTLEVRGEEKAGKLAREFGRCLYGRALFLSADWGYVEVNKVEVMENEPDEDGQAENTYAEDPLGGSWS